MILIFNQSADKRGVFAIAEKCPLCGGAEVFKEATVAELPISCPPLDRGLVKLQILIFKAGVDNARGVSP